jgi:hypothetical protein
MFFRLHGDEISDSNKKQVKSYTLRLWRGKETCAIKPNKVIK